MGHVIRKIVNINLLKEIPMVTFCSDHKCMKEKLDLIRQDRNFWHRILDSKWFFWAFTGLVVLWLGLNGWMVREIYAQKADTEAARKVDQSVDKKLEEIKEDGKTRDVVREQDKKEIKDQLEKTKKDISDENAKRDLQKERDQRELVRILMDIQKQIRNK
jgi:hypothetical protein